MTQLETDIADLTEQLVTRRQPQEEADQSAIQDFYGACTSLLEGHPLTKYVATE